MRITTNETDGTAKCVVEDYGDLLQIRTLSEWHPISEDPFTVATTVGNLSSVGLADPHADLVFPDPNLRDELVQVAAVAVAWLESF